MATIEKTYLFSENYGDVKYKKLGRTGFQTSVCGFGSYRVDYRVKEHNEALEYAIEHGINLIDTSSNYSDGGSEILIGNVIEKLVTEEKIDRDELIVISKGGYIQGENLALARQRESEGRPFEEVVKCSPDLWHCIHPDFLSDQITRSLERMKLEKIDVYLLHNPEYYLSYTYGSDIEKLRNEYYRRICEAFIHLESEVVSGRILYYGVSSNTFGEDGERWNYTSLDRLLKIAGEISPDNHFAVVQLPLNLLEKDGAAANKVLQGGVSFLELSFKHGLGVVTNRPLNAIENNKIVRLADFPEKEDRNADEVNHLIDEIRRQEEVIMNNYVEGMELSSKDRETIAEALSLSVILKNTMEKFQSANQFIEIKKQFFVPRANFAISEIFKYYPDDKDLINTLNYYATSVNILLDSVESIYARATNEKNRQFHAMLEPYFPKGDSDELSLSQKSVLMINSLTEVSSALIGMRSVAYVQDVLEGIRAPYRENVKQFWKSRNEEDI